MIRIAATAAFLLFAAAAHAQSSGVMQPLRTFPLDAKLREASGLAVAGPKSVFTHNDEIAIISEVNIDSGATVRSFALGKPTLAGDFEAIAIVGEAVWLAASDGMLIEGRIMPHGQRSRFAQYDTGIGEFCEIEGLAAASRKGVFHLLCKRSLQGRDGRLLIYQWSLGERFAEPRAIIDVALASLVAKRIAADFRPTDLAANDATGGFYILNSAGGVLEIDKTGGLVSYRPFDRDRHPQAEGLAFLDDGRLAIADEGGKRNGALTLYDAPKRRP